MEAEIMDLNPTLHMVKLYNSNLFDGVESKESSYYIISVIRVCIRKISEKDIYTYNDIDDDRLAIFSEKYKTILNSVSKESDLFVQKNKMIIVLKNVNEKEAKSIVESFQDKLIKNLDSDEITFVGIGKKVLGMKNISDSFSMADKIAGLLKVRCQEDDILEYGDLGVDALLLSINDYQCLEDYYCKILKPLDDYDAYYGTNYHYILECYAKNNFSAYDTAQYLMVHLSTVNDRIKKIQNILGVEMKDFEERKKLALALDIYQIKQVYIV